MSNVSKDLKDNNELENRLGLLLAHAERVLTRFERSLPEPLPAPDWGALAYRWRTRGAQGYLEPIYHLQKMSLADLHDIDDQKARISANTRQFVQGKRANNVLLTGARGTGKSSLVRAMLTEFSEQGLRVIEVDKTDLIDLPQIVELVCARAERFILFSDDLSFEDAEPAYKALKSVLDGSFSGVPSNVLIYATSNRRHLMPEYHTENLQTSYIGEEIHPGEAVEEKISLSERFGLWISFYPFGQEAYLEIVRHWLTELGVSLSHWEEIRQEALQWTMMRGARNGRVALQFARDYAGKLQP